MGCSFRFSIIKGFAQINENEKYLWRNIDIVKIVKSYKNTSFKGGVFYLIIKRAESIK